MQALAGCLATWDHAVAGITNKSLRAWMTGLRGVPYSMTQACYDLARLRGNGLIQRVAHANTYRLTADGLTFALVYSRIHDQVLYPLTGHDQSIAAPAPVRAAWRTITRHIDRPPGPDRPPRPGHGLPSATERITEIVAAEITRPDRPLQ